MARIIEKYLFIIFFRTPSQIFLRIWTTAEEQLFGRKIFCGCLRSSKIIVTCCWRTNLLRIFTGKTPTNEAQDIWDAHTLNRQFIKHSFSEIKFPIRLKFLMAKPRSLWEVRFLHPIIFVLILAFDAAVLMEIWCFSVSYFQLKGGGPVIKVRFLFSRKLNVIKVNVIKTLKFSSDCHIKICWSLRVILNTPCNVFWGT